MIYYKIRNKKTGLFHKGGTYEAWSKSGKTWDTLGKLRAMLTTTFKYSCNKDLSNWEVIEYEVKEASVKELHEVVDPNKLLTLLKDIDKHGL